MGASERDEFLRAAWRTLVASEAGIDTKRLVFVDEMGTNISLAPLYGWSRRGQRAHLKAPRNWDKNVTLLASITREGIGPCVRGLPGARPGTHLMPRSGSGDGQPLGSQGREGARDRRREELRAALELNIIQGLSAPRSTPSIATTKPETEKQDQ